MKLSTQRSSLDADAPASASGSPAPVLVAVLLVAGWFVAAVAGGETSNPRIPPAPVENIGELATPQQRLLAVAPLVGSTQGLFVDAAEGIDRFAARSKELGVSAARVQLWHDLFMNSGTPGLTSLSPVDLEEYALDNAGTWVLVDRFLEGREVTNTATFIWELLELDETHAEFNQLILERGVFEKWLKLPPANGETYLLGSFGTVTMDVVEGEEYGLGEGENAIKQVWNGQILGWNYPGTEELVKISVESLIVKQGRTYNQARATVHINRAQQRPSDYNAVQLYTFPGSDVGVYGSARFDGQDSYEKVSDQPAVRRLDRYWARAKADRGLLLDPAAVRDRELVRKVLR